MTTAVARLSSALDTLLDAGLRVEVAAPDASALRADPVPDVALIDLEDGGSAFDALGLLRSRDPALYAVALARVAPTPLCRDLLRAGARDLLLTPLDPAELLAATRRGLDATPAQSHAVGACVCGRGGVVPMEVLERRAIEGAIVACGKNFTEAARRLGIGRTTLYRRMRYFGLER